ncbi:MAG: acyltransferase [Pseudomonadota bacterium]
MKASSGFYIPSLDGIRAVAAMLVFVAHAGWHEIVPGGFGVTVFFFLSGYLITTLLRREYELTGDVNFKNFYLRRVYRIFPPLYIVLLIGFVLATTGVFEHDMRPGAVLAQVLYWTNYYFAAYGNAYFVPHTSMYWSLAVEEHFYFVFPMLFLAAVRHRSLRGAAMIFGLICLAGLAWRYWLVLGLDATEIYTYRATDSRFDSLMYGCILGVWQNPVLDPDWRLSTRRKWLILCTALGAFLFTLLYREEVFRETLRYSIQGIALFPLFWLAVRYPEWWVFRWLNWSPIRFLGTVSYTFYLSHVTMLNLASQYLNARGIVLALLGFVMTLVFSSLMYFAIERPIGRLRRKLHKEYR